MINTVSFPGLGLELTLNRVAFSPFGFPIYWYAIIIVTGFLLAWGYCSHKGPKFGITSDDVVDMLIFAVPLALVGARLYYILFYLDLFRNADGSLNFGKMLEVRDGGLAIYGGIIMAVIVLWCVCRYKKISFAAFADLGAFGLLIGQCVGRWGNFVNVEAYGRVTVLPWRMCSESIANELLRQGLVDRVGFQQILDGSLGVHPTFLYESLWNALGFLLLVLMARKLRKFDGQIFLSYLIWYGVGRSAIEGLRTDSLYFFHTPIRVSQVLGLASALVALVILLVCLKRKPTPEQLWVNRRAALEQAKTEGAGSAAVNKAEELPGTEPAAQVEKPEETKLDVETILKEYKEEQGDAGDHH